MSEVKTGFRSQVWGCITSPRKTLESVGEDNLGRGIVLVLIMVVLSASAGYYYGSKIQLVMPGSRMAITALFALGGGIGVITGWLIPTVILHILATLLAGGGGLKRILALTGFASIPHILRHILRLIDAYTITGEQLTRIITAVGTKGSLLSHFISQGTALMNVFSLWSIALVTLSVTVNYNTTKMRAALLTVMTYLALIIIRSYLPV